MSDAVRPDPNHPATQAQIRAAIPMSSTWVSANAGSGKTRVLTDRVARLLLRGTQPSRILCLTYTRAAAAEMQNRLFRRLGTWAMMPDAALRAELRTLGEDALSVETADLRRARTLFARALETPGGLKIQTIHSFCDLLLRRFPLEAGVSPLFEVMEERQAAQLRATLLEDMAEEGHLTPLAPYVTDPDPLLRDILAQRDGFALPPDEAAIMARIGLKARATAPDLVATILGTVPPDRRAALMTALAAGGKTDLALLDGLTRALCSPPRDALAALTGAFLTQKMEPRKSPGTKAVRAACPTAADDLTALAEATLAAAEAHTATAYLDHALALHGFAHLFLMRHGAAKAALGKLDFDDLIARARTLLRDSEARAWVQYRLDGGIDHVLVDEAQDTSPPQWDVIEALTQDFFAGVGARDTARTVFVVGDEKQSIYSFQGADPAAFGAKRSDYSALLDAAEIGLERCDLLYSFRSAPPILSLVDRVFALHPVHGLGGDIAHESFHRAKPGRVDLWPFLERPARTDESPWFDPVDQPPRDDPALLLADRIAIFLRDLLDRGQILPGSTPPRPVRAGDILILVRSRGRHFRAIIRALKAHGVPLAGADRLKVGDELAVRDLMALLAFLATDADDLSLAAVLRSPLGGVTEAGLFSLAHGRDGRLWRALRKAPEHAGLAARLGDLRDRADYLRPHELLEKILTTFGGRRALIARLGVEAEDGIDALLHLALDYERVEPPTLTGFLDWMQASEVEVSRQFDSTVNVVRVMTVHGAKGLEAPVVILPQTDAPRGQPHRKSVIDADGMALPAAPAAALPRALVPHEDARKAREREEAWRLLYVAMTRAETWLIVCGGGEKGPPDDCWYTAVEAAMADVGAPAQGGGHTLSLDWSDATLTAPPQETARPALPDWADGPGPAVPVQVAPIAPSRDGGTPHALPGEGTDTETALAWGHHLHRLIECFATAPQPEWPARAASLLALDGAPDDWHSALIAEALGVRTAPALAWMFTPDALSEVPVAGRVPALGPRPIRGQIDRLVVGDTEIWALDFKSNRSLPATPDAIPAGLVGQMALYHAALAAIWPDRRIRTALVWTRTATLMEISHEAVTAWLRTWDGG